MKNENALFKVSIFHVLLGIWNTYFKSAQLEQILNGLTLLYS